MQGGHPVPLIVSASGEVRALGRAQLLLGVSEPFEWHDEEITLDPDETIVLHTDGVTDTRGAEERFGEQRLHRVLAR